MTQKLLSILLSVCILLSSMLPLAHANETEDLEDAARAESYFSKLDAERLALEEEEPPKKGTGTTLTDMIARAEAIVNYTWIPSQNISTWNGNEYNGLTYFPAGEPVKGVPYTLFTSEVVSQSLCSLERYMALASSNYSATRHCVSVSAMRTGPVYGSCCADLVCEVFGGKFMSGNYHTYHSVSAIKKSSYGTTTVNVPISELRPGDAISDTGTSHIMWIGAVTDTQITLYEQTYPVARKVTVDKADCTDSDNYFVYGERIYNIVTRSNALGATQTAETRAQSASLADLQSRYPNGKYWNHYVSKTTECADYQKANGLEANANSVSSQGCALHGSYSYSEYVGKYDCNVFDGGMQCCGFARKLAYDVYGTRASGWTQHKTISKIKPGDVVHYYGLGANASSGHWVFVTAVSNGTVTVGECNVYGTNDCRIRWGHTYNLNNASSVTVFSAPYAFSSNASSSYTVDSRYPTPFKANTLLWWNTETGKTPVYAYIGGTSPSGYIYNGYNDNDDDCTIEEIYTNGWCKVTVPGLDGVHYCELNVFVNVIGGYNPWKVTAPSYLDCYRRWDHGSPRGYIDAGDNVWIISETGDMFQVIYPTSTINYCRWVDRCALTHTYTAKTISPTCTSQGYTLHTCTACNYSYKDTYTNATGHSYSYKASKNPTTSATGTLTGTCSKCSGTITVTLPKLNTTDYTKTTTTAATCTANGTDKYTWKTTTYGTFSFNATVNKLGHDYKNYKATTNPTTSATGVLTGTCSRCSSTTTVTLPKLNTTDYTKTTTTAATCTANGTDKYTWKTTTYGTFSFNATVNKLGHDYKNYKATTNPTTSATGVLTGTCSLCSATTTVTLPKLNTTDYTKTTTTAATCTANGTDKYTWKTTTYGTFSFTATTSAKGHTLVTDKAVAATCTETGLTEGSHCSVCNAVIKAQTTVAALGHSYTSKVTAPTCTAQGYTTYTCSRCSHSYKDTYTNATNHSYTYKATKNPTTSATGTLTGTCSKCSRTTTVTLPKLNTTDYTKTTTKAATCTEAGTDSYKWKTTTYGTFSFTATTLAKGHTPVTDKAVEATCTAAGKTEGSHCSVCNAVIKAQTTIAALGHSYTSKVTAPTCTTQGYTTYTCSRCSHSYKDTYTNATKHSYISETTAPTCTEQGYTTYTCSACGDSYKDNFVEATGHSYGYSDKGEVHEALCTTCGDSFTEGHKYTDNLCICGAMEVLAPITDGNIMINHSLNLASDISINYAVAANALSGYDSFHMEVQLPVYSGEVLTGFDTVSIAPVLNGGFYYFTMKDITAVNMNDVLVATLHMTKGKQPYVSKPDSYSIVTYALNQLNKDNVTRELKVLCADLLRYGAAAQTFKGYRTNAPATASMTAAHKAYLSDLNTVTFGNTNTVFNDISNPMITWTGKNLNLGSKVVVKFIFNAGAYTGNIGNLTLRMVYQDNSGVYRMVTLANPTAYSEANRQYAFEFDGLMAAELRTPLNVAVYNGDVQLSQTLQYSADTYGNNKTGSLGELCKALFAYSDSAKKYFS